MVGRMLASMLLCTAVAVQAPANAALYEFKLEGVVSYTLLPDVHIGDVAVMTFRVDDQDLEPSPLLGRYASVGLTTVTLPTTQLTAGDGSGRFTVKLHSQIVQYQDVGVPLGVDLGFQFPDGTITEDCLPLTLSLSAASTNSFHLFSGVTSAVAGRVTSYSATVVPEPSFVLGLCLMLGHGHRVCRGRKRGRDSLALNGYDCSPATGM